MSYTPENIEQIVQLGNLRLPAEACGIIILGELTELANMASDRTKNSVIHTAAMLNVIGDKDLDPKDITIWHTHPSNTVGPSEDDIANKPTEGPGSEMIYLVVAIPSGKATIY